MKYVIFYSNNRLTCSLKTLERILEYKLANSKLLQYFMKISRKLLISYPLGSLFEFGKLVVGARSGARTDSDGSDDPLRINRITFKPGIGSGKMSTTGVTGILF